MHRDEINILRATLAKQRRNRFTLQIQIADYAASAVPLHLLNQLRDAERAIADAEQRLRIRYAYGVPKMINLLLDGKRMIN